MYFIIINQWLARLAITCWGLTSTYWGVRDYLLGDSPLHIGGFAITYWGATYPQKCQL